MRRFKLWNEWRKHNKDGPLHHFLVLIGFTKSPSFNEWIIFFEEETDDEL